MNKQKLLEIKDKIIGNHFYNFSDEAQQALVDMIDAAIEEDGLDSPWDTFYKITCDAFMYYDDAWDYMKKYGDNYLADAVNEGFTTISQVAWYNLEQEFFDLLAQVSLAEDDFECPEDPEKDLADQLEGDYYCEVFIDEDCSYVKVDPDSFDEVDQIKTVIKSKGFKVFEEKSDEQNYYIYYKKSE